MPWLNGFERLPASVAGGDYNGGPMKILLHTTEGSTAAAAFAAFRIHGSWPTFTVDPNTRRRYQHYDTNGAARALKNLSGGVETNRDGVIQIEIVGFAGQSHTWSSEVLQWLGEQVIAPIVAAHPSINLDNHPTFYGEDAGFTIASASARQRMSYAAWDAFNGICGHQHAPENDHWDPGKLNIAAVVAAAKGQGDLTIMDSATKAYLDAHFIQVRLDTLASTKRVLTSVRNKFKKLNENVDDIDEELDAVQASIDAETKKLNAIGEPHGVD